jgi:PAS domain S-box-containing protein
MSAVEDAVAPAPAAKWNPRDAVIITRGGDPDRRIIYVNRAFCALTGYKADEVIGEDGDLLLSDGSLQMHSPRWLHTDSNGHDVHWIAQLRRKDGPPFWAEAHLTPVYAAEGKTTHFIIVLKDVTQREMRAPQTAVVG